MKTTGHVALGLAAATIVVAVLTSRSVGQQSQRQPDAVQEAQTPRAASGTRPEEAKTPHDRSNVFTAPAPSSPEFDQQPNNGQENGFVFARDPHGAPRPKLTFEDGMKAEAAEKANVTQAQRRLLETRYNLMPKLDPSARMSRGKPLAVGPTARLPRE